MPRSDFSALVKNPKMKLVLQDCGHLDSASLGKGYTLQVGIYRHKCTSGPSTWYRRAGISLQWWKSPRSATVDEMKRNLQSSGMVQVWSGTGQEANSKLNSSKYLRPGDIASMLSSDSAHGAMWTGEDWRSDAIQGTKPYPYSSVGRGGNQTFILWRHPALQEPGLSVQGDGLGNPMDGGMTSGFEGCSHVWPDFNVKPFPIMTDKHGQYTNEPLLLGIANHLRIEGGGGVAGLVGDTFGSGGSLDLLSVNGLSQIIQWEGWTGGSIETALTKPAVAKQQSSDKKGVITVGPGVTNLASPEVVEGKSYTYQQIASMFSKEIMSICSHIKSKYSNLTNLGQQVIDMAISLAYNGGVGKLSLLKDVTTKEAAANAFKNGPKTAAGKVLQGLVRRRNTEADIVLGINNENTKYYWNPTQLAKAMADSLKS